MEMKMANMEFNGTDNEISLVSIKVLEATNNLINAETLLLKTKLGDLEQKFANLPLITTFDEIDNMISKKITLFDFSDKIEEAISDSDLVTDSNLQDEISDLSASISTLESECEGIMDEDSILELINDAIEDYDFIGNNKPLLDRIANLEDKVASLMAIVCPPVIKTPVFVEEVK